MKHPESSLLTASAAARILGVSETAIRKRIKAGTLKATKKNGSWQIPRQAIERLLTEKNPSLTVGSNQTKPNSNCSDGNKFEKVAEKASANGNHSLEPNQTEPDIGGSSHKMEILETQLASFKRENEQLKKQVEHLQTQNDHLTQLLAVAQKSVQQLAEQNHLLLEDNRKKKMPFWKRILVRGNES